MTWGMLRQTIMGTPIKNVRMVARAPERARPDIFESKCSEGIYPIRHSHTTRFSSKSNYYNQNNEV